MTRGRPYEIAIIGMAWRSPGASDLTSFFENILSDNNGTREESPDRCNARVFCQPQFKAGDRVSSCRGEYLESPIRFDTAGHGIVPRTIEGEEPEQCLLRGATQSALTDAGIALDSLDDLSGASFIVEGASTTSLVAVDRAARALMEKRADLAIAGAVYLEADVDFPWYLANVTSYLAQGLPGLLQRPPPE